MIRSKMVNNFLRIELYQKGCPILGYSLTDIKENNIANLKYIFIDNYNRRNNFGSYLLKNTEEILKNKYNVEKLNLVIHEENLSNKLTNFYKKNGYNIINDQYIYDDSEKLYDIILFSKFL